MTRSTSAMTRRALVCAPCWPPPRCGHKPSPLSCRPPPPPSSRACLPTCLPAFKKASGLDVKVVALGTGQALDMARRGDADVVFVHDQVAEEKFVADGFGHQALACHVQRLCA